MQSGKRGPKSTKHVAFAPQVVDNDHDASESRASMSSQVLPPNNYGTCINTSIPIQGDSLPSPESPKSSKSSKLGRIMVAILAVLLSLASLTFASYRSKRFVSSSPHPIGRNDSNDGIHLVIGPRCGSLNGSFTDVNAGLPDLHTFDTIISFGDSYSKLYAIYDNIILIIFFSFVYKPILEAVEMVLNLRPLF